jgi:multiple sugar transport system permease protein
VGLDIVPHFETVATVTRGSQKSILRRSLPTIGHAVRHALLLMGSLAMAVPFLWTLKVSLSAESDIFVYPPTLLPAKLVWQNWSDAWSAVPFARYFLNSAIMTITITVGSTLVCAMAAYSFARMRVPGRDVLFMLVLATMMIPGQVLLIPQFVIIARLGWVNSYYGLIVPGIGSAFGVFLLRQFFLQIPADLEDAARIDGCGWIGVLWRIIVPLSGPGLATLSVLIAMGTWNAFLWPLIVATKADMYTVQIGLSFFFGEFGIKWGMAMAATSLVTIPTLLMFLSAQRFLVRGIVLTGMK